MLLEQQLEEIENYQMPPEMLHRMALKPMIRLQAEAILSCIEHYAYYALCSERSCTAEVLRFLLVFLRNRNLPRISGKVPTPPFGIGKKTGLKNTTCFLNAHS